MKKKLLFVIESLATAGAEKSLVTLLSVLDYSKYEVDLQLFSYGGELERYVPEEVNLLPPLSYTQFTNKGIVQQLLSFDIRKLDNDFGEQAAAIADALFMRSILRLYMLYMRSSRIPL